MEQLIVIDCFTSMGLHLKHFKATRVQEVRWLMPLESYVLYNAPIWVHKMETQKPITHKKNAAHTKNIQFWEMAGETFTESDSTRNIQFLVSLSRQF